MKNKTLLMTVAILIIAMSSVAQVTGTFTDSRDGKKYKTVKIGTQTWMAENFAYKASSGCWAYNNDTANVATYGYLYNWATAKSSCPAGWHLPSNAEWITLGNFVSGDAKKLKPPRLWDQAFLSDNNNSSGFSALPGGCRSSLDYVFYFITLHGYWWSSSEYNGNNAYVFDLENCGNGGGVGTPEYSMFHMKEYGLSVRYIKNQ